VGEEEGQRGAPPPFDRFAIAVGRFYLELADRLVRGARQTFEATGAEVEVHDVPGAYELPLAALYCAQSGRYAGVACLGAVIRGETDHYDYVCAEAAAGISRVSLDTGVPCAFGVLTVDTMEQALARVGGGKRHQGEDAAHAVIRMAELRAALAVGDGGVAKGGGAPL
jgi:6,7-dimethyl-8-ribityllumazine synthase